MDADSDRCATDLSDARVDVLGYACLVAIMTMGPGYHRTAQDRLRDLTVANGAPAPVVTSAGALVDGLHALDARRVALVRPYARPLTDLVVGYLEGEGIAVGDRVSLEITDNVAGRVPRSGRAVRHRRSAGPRGRGRPRSLGLRADALVAGN